MRAPALSTESANPSTSATSSESQGPFRNRILAPAPPRESGNPSISANLQSLKAKKRPNPPSRLSRESAGPSRQSANLSNVSASSSVNSLICPNNKRRRISEDPRPSEAVQLAVGLVEEEFKLCETASQEFPPEISSSHIRSAISRYEDEMVAASERSICCSCGSFVQTRAIRKIGEEDDAIRLLEGRLDQCGHHESSYEFCTSCHTALMGQKIPKFSAANSVNVTMCQHYPSALEDLTAVEESLIAKSHPVKGTSHGRRESSMRKRLN
jgi:hypothetical protein